MESQCVTFYINQSPQWVFSQFVQLHGDWFPYKTEAAAMAAAKSWLTNPS
jgi:hypothetical protein